MNFNKNDNDQLNGQPPLSPRRIRGWKGLSAPDPRTVANGHKASAKAYRLKCLAKKLDEVLGVESDDD